MIRILLLAFALLTLLTGSVQASSDEQVSEIYETYMPADKLVPVLQPMLGVNDRITAYHNKLLVKAPRERQEKLLEMLQEIDRPLRNLLISVRYSNQLDNQINRNSADIQYSDANKGVRIGGDDDSHQGDNVVVYKGSSRDSKIQTRVVTRDHFSTRNDNITQQIRVLEGQQGFLQVGEERPETSYVFISPYAASASTEYRMVGNGVYVIPQILKDKIRLELYTTNQRRSGKNQQQVQTTEAQSVLLVEPDVWTPFAGASVQSNTSGDSFTTSTRNLKQGNQGLELKVTIVK